MNYVHTQTSWGNMGGPKQIFIVKELYVGDASLKRYGPSDWVWLRLEIKQNHWSMYSEREREKKSYISCQFRGDVQTYGHRPRYTAGNDAEVWLLRSKTSVCCLMVAAASTIRKMGSFSISTSHRHLQRSLDWTGRANGLASQVTGPHTSGLLPMVPH